MALATDPAPHGKYSSKKSQTVAARALEKKAVKDRAATATKVIGVRKKTESSPEAGRSHCSSQEEADRLV